LPDDSPILKDLYASWAISSTKEGQFGMAAKCWIAAGKSKASLAGTTTIFDTYSRSQSYDKMNVQ
jgi:hypothetical protein